MHKQLALALLLAGLATVATPAASARVETGGPRADSLRGGAAGDLLRGGGGNDRLAGGGGRDRLLGGPGRDRLIGGPGNDVLSGGPGRDHLVGGAGRDRISCGAGRDTIIAGAGDVLTRDCERVDRPAARTDPAEPGCRFVTKTVLVLGLDGVYRLEVRVVRECDNPPPPLPVPEDSPWVGTLLQRNGFWYQYGPPFAALFRFTNDRVAGGMRRGMRTTYPTDQLEFGQTFPFVWTVEGNELTLQFTSGYVGKITLQSYDQGLDRIARSSSDTGAMPWHGCRDPEFPAFYAQLAEVCP
jgi:Ca2+-binding RTX toxin-like protein